MKVNNLEVKLEILEGVVFRLISENDDLKGRFEYLENILENCDKCENEKVKSSDDEEYNHTLSEIDRVVTKSGKEETEVFTSNSARNAEKVTKTRKDSTNTYRREAQDFEKRVEQRSQSDVIAFHAYLSTDSSGPLPAHHILKFDTVSLNRGNGYNAFDGIFIVPVSGTYVFTWAFMSEPRGTVSTQLMRNSDILGTRFADSATSTVWDFATGIVVADVDQGDHIYVQLRLNSHGKVLSIPHSRNTFSGWLLN
ncbi:complement C1q tumor necrosis factor-related protein 4-like isoform X2 [Ostrea edulis]|uniref:complement C1q tumor necrosis factor-related protein 4-like isoform X2 n=1 Tax=Ostrea edulis TaxID=37623 RepID=UPI0024AF44DB|nr:complement C1q tumor necrosis factor-related protein 4-like isoform X2 [Ostrea edulis]